METTNLNQVMQSLKAKNRINYSFNDTYINLKSYQ